MKKYVSPLQEAAEKFPQTQLWNDSCGMADIDLALSRGGCGATSNPVIVGNVLRKEMYLWEERLNEIIWKEMPDATDEEICWQISKEAGFKGAKKLLPLFYESGRKKRLAGHAGQSKILPKYGRRRLLTRRSWPP